VSRNKDCQNCHDELKGGVVTKQRLNIVPRCPCSQETIVVCANGTLGLIWHDASTGCLSCKWSDTDGENGVRRSREHCTPYTPVTCLMLIRHSCSAFGIACPCPVPLTPSGLPATAAAPQWVNS
jgi:hypothetical protein